MALLVALKLSFGAEKLVCYQKRLYFYAKYEVLVYSLQSVHLLINLTYWFKDIKRYAFRFNIYCVELFWSRGHTF